MTSISIRDEYDGKGTLTLWSGAFASDYEGTAVPLPDGSGYAVMPDYFRAAFTVTCPLRDDKHWMTTDAMIGAAWDRTADWAQACDACGAVAGEACDPFCLGVAAQQDKASS